MTLLRYEETDKMSANSRIYSFLSEFNLGSRIYTEKEPLESFVNSQIDYDTVEKILKQKRYESNLFLDNALSDI